jgi:hypothetical protein
MGAKLLLRYAYGCNISHEECTGYAKLTESIIENTFSVQKTLQSTNRQPNEIDIVSVVAELYFSSKLDIKSFEKAKTKVVFGFENFNKNLLCLDPTQLTEFVRRFLNNYQISEQEIGRQFDQHGMLMKSGDNKRTMQFAHKEKNTNGVNATTKHRYFFIKLDELTKYVKFSMRKSCADKGGAQA